MSIPNTLPELARRVRYADWFAEMSDDPSALRRHDADLKDLRAAAAALGPNGAKLLTLGTAANCNPSFEARWRWVGAYCWVHQLRLSHEEAQAFVSPERIDWARVDLACRPRLSSREGRQPPA